MRRRHGALAMAAAACALVCSTAIARAQSCAGPDGRWAELRLRADVPVTVDPGKLALLLRDRLATSGLGLCFRALLPASPAAAVVELRPGIDGTVVIDVTAGSGGQPAMGGTVDLRTIPADGHTLALATIAHEIVRGVLDPGPPPSVASAVAGPSDRSERSYELAAALSGSQCSGGLTQWGPDLQAAAVIVGWLSARVRLGYRRGGEVQAPHGRVAADAFLGGIGVGESLPSVWHPVRFGLYQRLDLVRVRFSPRAAAGERAMAASLNALVASAGLAVGVRLGGPLSLSLQAGPSWALMGARARDDGKGVVALDGLGVELMAGLTVEL